MRLTNSPFQFFCLILLFHNGCADKTSQNTEQPHHKIIQKEFSKILDSANVTGSILVYRPTDSTFYSNDFSYCEKGTLPASTFKIANTMIGLETGVLQDTSHLFKWDGNKRLLPVWEKDLNLKEAYQLSCVPCYQAVARDIGSERMGSMLKIFKYGDMVVTDSNIDNFWLQGNSKISLFEQIDFLHRFYTKSLAISDLTHQIMMNIMLLDKQESYSIYDKTGWVLRGNQNIGWFVGILVLKNETYYFATRIEPKPGFDMDLFPKARIKITMEALGKLGLL